MEKSFHNLKNLFNVWKNLKRANLYELSSKIIFSDRSFIRNYYIAGNKCCEQVWTVRPERQKTIATIRVILFLIPTLKKNSSGRAHLLASICVNVVWKSCEARSTLVFHATGIRV